MLHLTLHMLYYETVPLNGQCHENNTLAAVILATNLIKYKQKIFFQTDPCGRVPSSYKMTQPIILQASSVRNKLIPGTTWYSLHCYITTAQTKNSTYSQSYRLNCTDLA